MDEATLRRQIIRYKNDEICFERYYEASKRTVQIYREYEAHLQKYAR